MSDHEQQPLHGWVLAGAVTMLVSLLGIAVVLSLGIAKEMANPMHHGALFLLELLFTIGLIMTSADLVVRAVAGRVVRALAEECQRMDHLEASLTQLRRDYVAASVDGLVAAVPNLAPALASAHDMPRQRLLRDGHSPDEIDTYAADMSRYVELGRELERRKPREDDQPA